MQLGGPHCTPLQSSLQAHTTRRRPAKVCRQVCTQAEAALAFSPPLCPPCRGCPHSCCPQRQPQLQPAPPWPRHQQPRRPCRPALHLLMGRWGHHLWVCVRLPRRLPLRRAAPAALLRYQKCPAPAAQSRQQAAPPAGGGRRAPQRSGPPGLQMSERVTGLLSGRPAVQQVASAMQHLHQMPLPQTNCRIQSACAAAALLSGACPPVTASGV